VISLSSYIADNCFFVCLFREKLNSKALHDQEKTGYIKKQNLTLIAQFTQVYSKNKQTKQNNNNNNYVA